MHAILGSHRKTFKGEPLPIDCPMCHEQGAWGIPRHLEERLLLFHLIPLFTFNTDFIDCQTCGEALTLRGCRMQDVYQLSPEELSARLQPYVSAVGRFCVIASLALFCCPFVMPIIAVIGFFLTRRHKTWRRLGIVGICLSSVVTVIAILSLIFVRNP